MPITFEPLAAGIVGDEARVARAGHALWLSGEALDLLTIVPDLATASIAAPAAHPDVRIVPYHLVYWVLGPALVVNRADYPLQPKYYRWIVDAAQRLRNPDHAGEADQDQRKRRKRRAENILIDRPHARPHVPQPDFSKSNPN